MELLYATAVEMMFAGGQSLGHVPPHSVTTSALSSEIFLARGTSNSLFYYSVRAAIAMINPWISGG